MPRLALTSRARRSIPSMISAGKPLVLIFVRTDCPVSNRYAPTIQALSHKYSGAAVMMLVYPDKSESAARH